jgi:hypothetical protein
MAWKVEDSQRELQDDHRAGDREASSRHFQRVAKTQELENLAALADRLCGLVVKVPDYTFRGPGSIHGATRFFLRSCGSGTGSTQPRDDN